MFATTQRHLEFTVEEDITDATAVINPTDHPWKRVDPPSAIQLFVRFLSCLRQGALFSSHPDASCGDLRNTHPLLFNYDSIRSVETVQQATPILEAFLSKTTAIDSVTLRTFLKAIMPARVRDATGGLPFIVSWNNERWSWFVYHDQGWYSVLKHYSMGPVELNLGSPGLVLSGSENNVFERRWKGLIDMIWGMAASSPSKGDLQKLVQSLLHAFLLKVYEDYFSPPPGSGELGVNSVLQRNGIFL